MPTDSVAAESVIRVSAACVTDAAGRVLLVRKRGSQVFMQPGGKPEPGETAVQTLVRELGEELSLDVDPASLDDWGRFRADTANEPGHVLIAQVFGLPLEGEVEPAAEIEEARWFTEEQADALGVRLAPLARRMLDVAPRRRHITPFVFDTPILTERLRLRPITAEDAVALWRHRSREDVCRFLLHDPWTLEEARTQVADWARHTVVAAEGDFLQLVVAMRETGEVIGELYFNYASREHRFAEIGWIFHPDHHGRGYATEGARELLRIAFDEMGLHRVIAELDAVNAASAALCRRLGMREEALRRGDFWQRGEWADTLQFAVCAEEWRG